MKKKLKTYKFVFTQEEINMLSKALLCFSQFVNNSADIFKTEDKYDVRKLNIYENGLIKLLAYEQEAELTKNPPRI